MSDVNPILLLVVGLFVLAGAIVWGLGIRIAVTGARARRRRAWPWVLAAIVPGPIFLGAAYLSRNFRRSVAGWVAAQAIVLAGACVAAALWLPEVLGKVPVLDLLVLLAAVLAALGPLIVLALLGPRPRPAGGGAGQPLIEATRLHKSYDLGGRRLKVLRGVSLSVRRGEFVAILGTSGSGKSTLLHLLGLLDQADGGSILLEGTDSTELSSSQRDRTRCVDIGFVFQFYHLLPELNVVENVLLPAMSATGAWRWPAARRGARRRALGTLERLGLGERLAHRPRQLSGGEQQRVAIARALVNSPKILLADEPTGNLDSRTGAQIVALLKKLNEETEQTIVMVTHDEALAREAGRIVHLRDGRLHRANA